MPLTTLAQPIHLVLESWFSITGLLLAYQIKPLETWVALSMSSQVQFLAESPEVRPGKFTDKSSMNKLFQT